MSDDRPVGEPGAPDLPAGVDSVAAPGDPEEAAPLSESFLSIWLRPRETVRRIVARDPRYGVLAIAALGGIPQLLSALPRAQEGRSLATLLLIGILGGPCFGILGLYVAAALTRFTGRRFLHGEAPAELLRTAMGWGSLPHVLALPLWLLASAAFGTELYTAGSDLLTRSPAYLLFSLANLGLQIWSLYIASHGVAEVQGYGSAWKGFGNLLLGVLIVLAALLVLFLALTLVLLLVGRVVG